MVVLDGRLVGGMPGQGNAARYCTSLWFRKAFTRLKCSSFGFRFSRLKFPENCEIMSLYPAPRPDFFCIFFFTFGLMKFMNLVQLKLGTAENVEGMCLLIIDGTDL